MTAANSPSILITDDDRNFRDTLVEIFRPRFRTLVASDGEEALDIVCTQPVDLLVVDNNMPKLSGLETLQLVQKIRRALPCILLSARLDDVVREQAMRLKAFDVLPKPVSRTDITGAVDLAMRAAYGCC